MIRTNGKPGQPNDTKGSSPDASPVHQNGRTETEGPGPNKLSTQMLVHGTNLAISADRPTASVQMTSLRFFLVAALSLIELIYYRTKDLNVAYLAAGTCLVFIVVGLQTFRLRRCGFLAALSLYAISTTAMAVLAMTTEQGIELVIKPLIVHGILIFSLYRNFETRSDLQLLENRH